MGDADELVESALATGFDILLRMVVENDTNYDARAGLVLELMATAKNLGYETGIRIDPNEPEWPVIFIELPTGQISYHMPQHSKPWDGHNSVEKLERIERFLDGARSIA